MRSAISLLGVLASGAVAGRRGDSTLEPPGTGEATLDVEPDGTEIVFGVVTLWLLASVFAISCGGGNGVRVIKLAHGLPTSHPVHEAMVFLAQRAAEKSGGRIRIDIHPAEQLGTERECIELLQMGALGMTKVSASVLENFVPLYAVFSLPYLFRDEAHRQKVFHGEIGKRILEAGEEQGLRGLTYYDAGSRSFYSKEKPISSPADLDGLKIRTQESSLAINMVKALGGAATPIAWGELYTSLQQGVVDAAENNPPSFYLSRHYEVARYYSLDEHTATPDVLLISVRLWHELSPEEKAAVSTAAEESAKLQLRLWRKATEEALEALRAAGVHVVSPDKAPFVAAVESIYEPYRGEPELAALIDDIRAVE
ncbi:MAG TPA: TRAP transporter substrate-binding protein [Vicinamibacteria bacterium]|nr:TRAP transporter substrate-binding protein [Vicinamibacteria bacterium]